MGLKGNNELYQWGASYALTGTAIQTAALTPILTIGSNVESISIAQLNPNFAYLNNANQIYTASTGPTALNRTVFYSSPVQVGTSSWVSVSTGAQTMAALRSDYSLWMWGNNESGQIGDNTVSIIRSSPIQIGTGSWNLVSTKGVDVASPQLPNTFAIRNDGKLFGWGDGTNGQSGYGFTTDRSSPVNIGAGSDYAIAPIQIGQSSWSLVAAGGTHAAATSSDNVMFTWGLATDGQLGLEIGDVTTFRVHRSSPVQLGTSYFEISPTQVGTSSWSSVAAGLTHVTALRSDSALFAWGLNNNGELGLDDRIHRSSPVQVGTSSWTLVTAGYSHTAAANTSNIAYTWGNAAVGQLGLEIGVTSTSDRTANRSSPVQLGSSYYEVQP